MTRTLPGAALAVALAMAAPLSSLAQVPRKTMPADDVLEANAFAVGLQGYVWGAAPVAMQAMLYDHQSGWGAAGARPTPLNALSGAHLATAEQRGAAFPNPSIFQGSAWLDLSEEPVAVVLPEMPEAIYWSASFVDAYASGFFVASTKGFGPGGARLLVQGPGHPGPAPTGFAPVASPTPFALVLVRIAPRTTDPADVEAAARYQAQVRVIPRSQLDNPRFDPLAANRRVKLADPHPSEPDPLRFLAILTEWITLNPPGPEAKGLLGFWSRLGVGPGAQFRPAALTRAERSGLERGLEAGANLVALNLGPKATAVNGWNLGPRDPGGAGDDPVRRTAWSLQNLGSLPPSEAAYAMAYADAAGDPLDGRKDYVLHLGKEEVPKVRAFWSLAVYELPSGQLHPNPLGRYQLGTQAPGMRAGADGSLDVLLSGREPPADRRGNWIPTPGGEFAVSLRMYLPDPEMDGLWTGGRALPGIQRRAR